MILQFVGPDFVADYATVSNAEQLFSTISQLGPKAAAFDAEGWETLSGSLRGLQKETARLGLEVSQRIAERILELLAELPVAEREKRIQEVRGILMAFKNAVMTELGRYKYALVPPEKGKYFEQAAAMGGAVDAAFPEAVPDVREAGNCLALGLDTASVFHCMRVAEFGLRRLAKSFRGVKLPKNTPVDQATWDAILSALDKKITEVANRPKRHGTRSPRLVYYSQMSAELRAFKDAWRNHVSHTRASYDEFQSASVFSHVASFMARLAKGAP